MTKQTDANEDDEFTFKIKLTTPNGQIIDDDLYWYIDGQGSRDAEQFLFSLYEEPRK